MPPYRGRNDPWTKEGKTKTWLAARRTTTEEAKHFFYHGTGVEALASIAKDGLRQACGDEKRNVQVCVPGVYLTLDPVKAGLYASGGEGGAILRIQSEDIPRCTVEGEFDESIRLLDACIVKTADVTGCRIKPRPERYYGNDTPLIEAAISECDKTGWVTQDVWGKWGK